MAGSACDVCGDPAVAVACSATGPVSYAYCSRCAHQGYEPWGACVAMIYCCGGSMDGLHPSLRVVVERTAAFLGKTVDDAIREAAICPACGRDDDGCRCAAELEDPDAA